MHLKHKGTHAETRFRLSPKRMSPIKSAGVSVQSTAGSRGVHISVSNAGYTMFRGSVIVLATHSIRQFPLHFPLPHITLCHQVSNALYLLLHGCEPRAVILRRECRLRVSENRVLWEVFGPKREEVTGDWRK